MDFLNELWQDAQALVAPLIALLKGMLAIVLKIIDFATDFIKSHV